MYNGPLVCRSATGHQSLMQFIDLSRQQSLIREKIEMRIKMVLDSGEYIMGSEIFELEKKLADYVGVTHCITCSSGTDALLMPLMARDIGIGDAVITTPFTFIATAEVIKLAGATPVFVDICPDTFNINPALIPEAVQHTKDHGLNPKAIIPVDLFGLPALYEEIEKIAEENSLFVLEDAAQSFGGEISDRKVCSFGDAAATSFFPAKPLGCYGDGGAIFTMNEQFVEKLKSIRIHGQGATKYENIRTGINGRMDTIQAAILLEKLNIFPDERVKRNHIASQYRALLKSHFVMQRIPEGYESSWAQFSLLAANANERSLCREQLKSFGIPTAVYYSKPLHLQDAFKNAGYKEGDFSVSESISKRIFSLPMHPYLADDDIKRICKILRSCAEKL